MEALFSHVFYYSESYTVLLLWIIVPMAGAYGFVRYHRRSRAANGGTDAENRRAA